MEQKHICISLTAVGMYRWCDMKKRTTIEEMNAICTMLISDFLKKFHYSNTRVIDIESFVTRYLGTTILYEDFAVNVPGRGGFISDGIQALPVLRNGMRQFVIFPENVIVIDSSLKDIDNLAKYRFTVAHEAAHFIMSRHVGGDFTAAFHTEYVDGEYYTPQMLKEMLSLTETITNRAAACLLMPDFIVDKVLNNYNAGNKVTIYTGSKVVIPDASKSIIQQMADCMGVSFSTCYYRLQELSLLDKRPLEEYAAAFSIVEGDHV